MCELDDPPKAAKSCQFRVLAVGQNQGRRVLINEGVNDFKRQCDPARFPRWGFWHHDLPELASQGGALAFRILRRRQAVVRLGVSDGQDAAAPYGPEFDDSRVLSE